jgi:hypothetical protein
MLTAIVWILALRTTHPCPLELSVPLASGCAVSTPFDQTVIVDNLASEDDCEALAQELTASSISNSHLCTHVTKTFGPGPEPTPVYSWPMTSVPVMPVASTSNLPVSGTPKR